MSTEITHHHHDAIQIAERWRASQDAPLQLHGWVMVYQGEVYGWCAEVGNPSHERPGALAISVDGSVWEAQGGNDADGATGWYVAHKKP